MAVSPYVLGDTEPPMPWLAPWEYDAWRIAVLQGEECDESLLRACYQEQWEPSQLHEALFLQRRFLRFRKVPKTPKPPKPRARVMLNIADVERRIAKAIYVECARLIARNMMVEARNRVFEIQEQAGKAAGIQTIRITSGEF